MKELQVYNMPYQPRPSRLTLLLAHLFGRKVIGRDGTNVMVGYMWRGILYVVSESRERMEHLSE